MRHARRQCRRARAMVRPRGSVLDLDVAGLDRLEREIGWADELASLRIALGVGIVVPEERTADLVPAVAGLAIVLDREEHRVDEARVIRPLRRAAEDRDVADGLHAADVDLQL